MNFVVDSSDIFVSNQYVGTKSGSSWQRPVSAAFVQGIACAVLLLLASGGAFGDVVALPACPGDAVSEIYALTVDGQNVPVGSSKFNGGKIFHVAEFETDKAVQVRLQVTGGAEQTVRIRPSRSKREYRLANGTIEFAVRPESKLVVQAGALPPLFLFALPIEKEKPSSNDPATVYFGPGDHTAGEIRLTSGQTLYLAAGARVRGRVRAFEAHDIAIRGRGVLDAREHTDFATQTHGILMERCKNVSIEGIQVRTGDWWQILLLLTDDVRIDHLHTLSFGRNNDGVDTDGARNLLVRDSFIGCGDDGFGFHAVDAVVHGEPVTQNCVAERCVIWNEYAGNGLRIGASTETSEMSNITFRSIDVLHTKNNAIMIDHSDWAHLQNITFHDFNNDTPKPLAKIAVAKTGYSNNTGYRDERGQISDLRFREVRSTSGGISIRGFDDEHCVRGVQFHDCWIANKPVRTTKDVSLGPHVFDVQFADRVIAVESRTRNVSTQQLDELLLDNGMTGCWAFAGADLDTLDVPDCHGGTTWRLNRLRAGKAAVYEPRLEGRYEVAVHWGTHEGVATNAPWTVSHKRGYTTHFLNQNRSAGWHVLGEFELGPDSWVRLVDPHYPVADGPVVADAVRFRRVRESGGATTQD